MSKPTPTEKFIPTLEVPQFKEHKTTQAAAILATYCGGKIDVYKLIKLIYLIDRESLKRRGSPVTYDRSYNTPLGPTPINTYHLINNPWTGEYWSQSFSAPESPHVIKLLRNDTGEGKLSRFEVDLIHEVFEKFGKKSFNELQRYMHSLPEFDDPGRSSSPIDWGTLLKAVGWYGDDLIAIKQKLSGRAMFERRIENMSQEIR